MTTLGFVKVFGGDFVWISSVVGGLVIGMSVAASIFSLYCDIRSGLVFVWSMVPLSRFYLIRSSAVELPSLVLPLFKSKLSSGLASSPSSSSRSRSIAR